MMDGRDDAELIRQAAESAGRLAEDLRRDQAALPPEGKLLVETGEKAAERVAAQLKCISQRRTS